MKAELALYKPEIQGNELEQYADKVADSVFIPLAEFDLFWLSLIEGNEAYWAAETQRVIEKWMKPEEDEVEEKKSRFVQVYPSPNYERKA